MRTTEHKRFARLLLALPNEVSQGCNFPISHEIKLSVDKLRDREVGKAHPCSATQMTDQF